MPENLRTTESLFAKHSSKPYNPKLAHVFFISGMIEAWGRGFDKIRAACDELYQTPVPEYDVSDDGVMVHCVPNAEYLKLINGNRLGITESILSRFSKREQETVLCIIKMIEENGSVSNIEIRSATGKAKPTLTRLLAKMCDEGVLVSDGAGRATCYQNRLS